MKHFEFERNTSDGLLLYGQGWEPDRETRAVVALVHGHGEHSLRYAHMAEALGHGGYAIIALDLRGHGRSEGRRGHTPGYGALMSDLDLLLNEVSSRWPDAPRFLFGHSLGGNLAVYYAMQNRTALSGVIAAAPLFRIAFRPPKWKTVLLDALYAMHIPLTMSTGLERSALTRDADILEHNRTDPLAHKDITPQLAVEMIRNGEWMLKHATELALPTLVMHGEEDRITSASASIEFASKAEHFCTLKIWKGFYHELHNEPERQQVFSCMMKWIDQVLQ